MNLSQEKAGVLFGRSSNICFCNHPSVFGGFTTFISKHCIPPATRGRKSTQQLENNYQHLKTTLNTPPLLFHQTSGLPLPVFPSASGTSNEMEINYHKARLGVSELLMIFRYIARKHPHRQVILVGGVIIPIKTR